MIKNHDELHEECGVVAIWGDDNAAQLTYYGLHSLQHRGQEAAGIVVRNKSRKLLDMSAIQLQVGEES